MVQCIPLCLEGVSVPGHADGLFLCQEGFCKCICPKQDIWCKSVAQCCCVESRCAFPFDNEVPCNLNMYCINCITDFKVDFKILKEAPAVSYGSAANAQEMER
ncbi:MAG: hypothetical protein SGPRY_012310 [Prymnesium sp.]